MNMENIVNWIDRELASINKTEIYKIYFTEILINEIGDSNYLTNEEKGIGIVLNKDFLIVSIHLYSGDDGVCKIFKGKLPFDVKFNYSKNEVEYKMGEPNDTGGGYSHSLFGYVTEWSKYYFENYSLHFQYSVDKTFIKLIRIASLREE